MEQIPEPSTAAKVAYVVIFVLLLVILGMIALKAGM